jgi:hypothetical protein
MILRNIGSRVYNKLPQWLQVLADDTHKLNEYPSFMRLLMTGGTAVFLYKFGQTMMYLDSEKRPETEQERKIRRENEKKYREKVRQEAMNAGKIVPPTDEHIREILERAQVVVNKNS